MKYKKALAINLLFYLLTISNSVFGQATKPNIVFILADDLGNGDLSYTNPDSAYFRHTPNIDQICQQGIYFSNFYVHHVCSPTRAGLLTGKHYAKVGAGAEVGGTLDNSIPNVAKDLKANGYATAAFGKWHNSYPNFPAEGNGRIVSSPSEVDTSNNIFENFKGIDWGEGVNAYGFDEFMGFYSGGGDYFSKYNKWHYDIDWWTNRSYTPRVRGYVTDLIGAAALEFIDTFKDQPFYCYLPMEAVHGPLQVKRSDLQELCSFFPGEWDYVKDITSSSSGRKISEVEQIKCETGEEFDWTTIDPGKLRFQRLIYATVIYSMDRVVGDIYAKLDEHNLRENTIIFFCSDNGANSDGLNTPFRGSKHTLWEGGIHVPAAIWWPGTIDTENLGAYSPEDNVYDGFTQYVDYYPTIMALAGLQPSAADLDGLDISNALLNRTESRFGYDNPYFGVDSEFGAIRAGNWKLHYNEITSDKKLELYNLENDISETFNVKSSNPGVRDDLIALYRDWYNTNNFAFSFLPIQPDNITHPMPSPQGDVMEVKATQTKDITNGDSEGVFVRFAKPDTKDYDNNVESGDRIEFDIFVPSDSDNDQGFYFTPGGGWVPFYDSKNGITQDSLVLTQAKWPRNTWVRKVVGIGNRGALPIPVNYIALHSTEIGSTHFYLDNIVLRKNNGTIKAVIWDDNSDFVNLQYRYRNTVYNSLSAVQGIIGFPFSELTVTTAPKVLPEKASAPNPENGVNEVSVAPVLSWTSGGNLVQYKVYFGTNSTLTEDHVIATTYETSYKLAAPLTNNTKYYWRIDGINDTGVTVGDVWNFTTEVVTAPAAKAENRYPLSNNHVSQHQILIWKSSQNAINYNVYFGNTNPPVLVSNQVDTFYTPPDTLENDITYYWRVDAVNTAGATKGDIWNFLTTFNNMASLASVFATSESDNKNYSGENIIDGIFGYDGTGEWFSKDEQTPMVQLRWAEYIEIDKVVLYEPAGPSHITAGLLTFNDGTSINIGELPDDGSPYEITFDPKSVRWARFQIIEATSDIKGLGEFEVFKYTGTTSIDKNSLGLPTKYALEQNYPNPFNPKTIIYFSIPNTSNVKLIIYDLLGNKVKTLIDGNKPAGSYTVSFDASNFASGIYIYRLVTDNFIDAKKMILMR